MFLAESRHDSVYSPFVTRIWPANPNAGRYVATAPSATVAWQETGHMFYSVIYTHFLTGDFFERALPNQDVNYVAAWIAYRF
jgi:hypothetical protein